MGGKTWVIYENIVLNLNITRKFLFTIVTSYSLIVVVRTNRRNVDLP